MKAQNLRKKAQVVKNTSVAYQGQSKTTDYAQSKDSKVEIYQRDRYGSTCFPMSGSTVATQIKNHVSTA